MIKVDNLSVTYDNRVTAVDHVSLEIPAGRMVGIIGPNGAGKSSLIKGILNLVETSSGQVRFNDKSLKEVQHRIAYVEQRSHFDLDFPIHVQDVVLMGTFPRLGWLKRPGKKEKQEALAALKSVEMADFKDRQIGALSGGQLQRILIARTLAQKADIIFLDEPFVGVDAKSEHIIIEQLHQLRDEGKTIVVVHHDLGTVEDYFDELILIDQKLIDAGPVTEVFTRENLMQAYGSDAFLGMGAEN